MEGNTEPRNKFMCLWCTTGFCKKKKGQEQQQQKKDGTRTSLVNSFQVTGFLHKMQLNSKRIKYSNMSPETRKITYPKSIAICSDIFYVLSPKYKQQNTRTTSNCKAAVQQRR